MQGRTDVPLAASGIEALKESIHELDGSRLGAIWTGPDEASIATADQIAQTTGGVVTSTPDLAEIDLGLWEGMLVSEMVSRFPRACKAWMDDPSLINPPGGETLAEAHDRLTAGVGRIIDRARSGAAIAFVLRPIAMGMVRCWLAEEPTCNIWGEAKDAAWSRWFDVQARVLTRPASVR